MPDLPSRVDVVVVGAGLAGLCTAADLSAAGLDVLVLEASDAPGGRVRTDEVDGLLLDRGFQVFNTAYPEAARRLDLTALELRDLLRGALVAANGRRHLVADPRRVPHAALSSLGAPIGGLRDKARLAAWTAGVVRHSDAGAFACPDTSAGEALRAAGLSRDGIVDRFLRPFLAGVFLEDDLETSSRFLRLVWRTFVLGRSTLPATGMQAIPRQLATVLPADALHLQTPVEAVAAAGVLTPRGDVSARAVVVATGPREAAALLPGLPVVATRSVTTFYHVAPEPPTDLPALVVDAERRGPVVNSVVLTNAAASYAPDGRVLVSSSVLGCHDDTATERVVRAHLRLVYGTDTGSWQHVRTYAIRDALPAMPAPHDFRQPVRLGPGRYVCGDHRDSGSIQGAMVSGRRAAAAVLTDIGVSRRRHLTAG